MLTPATSCRAVLQARLPTQIRHASKFDFAAHAPIPAHKRRHIPTTGTYPAGFRVGSVHAGIKPASAAQPDLVLVASDRPACGAAVFTKNEFAAPSITVSREVLQRSRGEGLRGVLANSGVANLLNGPAGLEDSRRMGRAAGDFLAGEGGKGEDCAMVMHTGMGGKRLPIDNIVTNIPILGREMGNTHDHWLQAATGMLTTDTFPKLASCTFTLPSAPNTTFSLAGLTKGAGMVHPNMATTLAIMCTDAPITASALQQALAVAADRSYNCISIDGDTSTNDMVALLANGAAADSASRPVTYDSSERAAAQSADFVSFQKTLAEFMARLAQLVVRDGEGATKFITIRVRGATPYAAGKHVASVIARSILVRTAIGGGDPNWGGILIALGYSLADTQYAGKGVIVPEMTSISLVPVEGAKIKFLDKGVPQKVDQTRVKEAMALEDIEMLVELRDDGTARGADEETEAVYWTCDLTHDFVTLNGEFDN